MHHLSVTECLVLPFLEHDICTTRQKCRLYDFDSSFLLAFCAASCSLICLDQLPHVLVSQPFITQKPKRSDILSTGVESTWLWHLVSEFAVGA